MTGYPNGKVTNMTELSKDKWASIISGTDIDIEDVKTIIRVPYGYWVVTDYDPEIWIGDCDE